MLSVQTQAAFHSALGALEKAGAVLVEFEVGLMLAEQHKNAPEFFTYDYEMPREIARQVSAPWLVQDTLQIELPLQPVITMGCVSASDPVGPMSAYCFIQVLSLHKVFSRYLYQHRYNITLTELIDRIDSPLIKASMEGWAYRDLEDWPSPQQYLYMLATGVWLF